MRWDTRVTWSNRVDIDQTALIWVNTVCHLANNFVAHKFMSALDGLNILEEQQ